MNHFYLTHSVWFQMGERTESDKCKQWGGCVEGNYLPELLACGQREDIHLFCIEPDSLVGQRGGS